MSKPIMICGVCTIVVAYVTVLYLRRKTMAIDYWEQKHAAINVVGFLSEETVKKATVNLCARVKDASEARLFMEMLGIKDTAR